MTTLIVEARRSHFSVFLLALALLGALILGGAGGYQLKSLQLVTPTITSGPPIVVDSITGYRSGSVDDQRMLAFLVQSGYEGGGTVVAPALDPFTGYPFGSADDQRILKFLVQSGYEGGGTVIKTHE